VVQLVLFPLLFVSGTYMPIHSDVLNRISGALPVRPFNQALLGPFAQHAGLDWKNLGVLLAWVRPGPSSPSAGSAGSSGQNDRRDKLARRTPETRRQRSMTHIDSGRGDRPGS